MSSFSAELGVRHDQPRDVNQEEILVWDRKGVVILWADGHRSRFMWSALRAECPCAECTESELITMRQERQAA
jgi:DUF971 family protein